MIRYEIEGRGQPSFEEMVRYLGQYPKILDKYASSAMKRVVSKTASSIKPNIPVRMGASQAAFFNEILGYGATLTGVVGFRGGKGAPYHINIVEHGARPHSLVKRSRQRTASAFARFQKRQERGTLRGAHVLINGTWVTMASHPGFSKRGFMAAGFSAAQPMANAEMQKAVDNAFQEVATK